MGRYVSYSKNKLLHVCYTAMIDPAGIRRKAQNLYPAFQKSWLDGVEFFPKNIPCDLQVPDDGNKARAALDELRDGSKEVRGFGYRIEWKDRQHLTEMETRTFQRCVLENRRLEQEKIPQVELLQAFAAIFQNGLQSPP